jgi:RNA polymerase sigma-70 factor (ECF subfamily)
MLPGAIKIEGHQQQSDAEIVERVCAGDISAFESLMRRYNRPLYRTARSILKDDAEAQDALQEAYLLAFRNLKTYRGAARLLTWLTRIVVNEAIARSRKANRRAKIIQLGDLTELDNGTPEASMSQPDSEQPEQLALRAEVRRLIEKKIDDLPEAYRIVFVMRELEELTIEETAACLEIPEATVRSRHFRAKGLLRESLSREIDFAFEDTFSFDGERCDRIVSGVLARIAELPGGAEGS